MVSHLRYYYYSCRRSLLLLVISTLGAHRNKRLPVLIII